MSTTILTGKNSSQIIENSKDAVYNILKIMPGGHTDGRAEDKRNAPFGAEKSKIYSSRISSRR